MATKQMYLKAGDSLSHQLRVIGGGAYTFALLSGPPGAAVSPSGVASYTTSTLGDSTFQVRVQNQLGEVDTFSVKLTVQTDSLCVWNGLVSADFATAANWDFCTSGVPVSTDWISIDEQAVYQPLVSVTSTVRGFGVSVLDGGTLSVAVGVNFLLDDTLGHFFNSDVTLIGADKNCTTCWVYSLRSVSPTIRNNATLTLGPGIEMGIFNHRWLLVGNASSPGHFRADYGDNTGRWPTLACLEPGCGSGGNNHYNGIWVEGPSAANRSSVHINGLRIWELEDHSGSGTRHTIQYRNFYRIDKFDNVHFRYQWDSNHRAIMFDNCANSLFNDFDWDNIGIGFYGVSAKSSVDARCNPGQAINITEQFATGQTLSGASYEVDPFSIINWF